MNSDASRILRNSETRAIKCVRWERAADGSAVKRGKRGRLIPKNSVVGLREGQEAANKNYKEEEIF